MNQKIQIVSETIQAANIQADATICAASIAALGLIVGLVVSWYTAKHIQRKTSIDEIRRNTYLKTVDSYSRMIASLSMITVDPKKTSDEFKPRFENFVAAIDQSMFVCDTKTKVKLIEFYEIFFTELKLIEDPISSIFDASQDCEIAYQTYSQIMSELEPIKSRLIDLQLEDPRQKNIENALQLFDDKLNFSHKYLQAAQEKGDLVQELCTIAEPKIHDFIIKINTKAVDVMYSLRQEIGIKTDIKTDMELNERLKKLVLKGK